MKEEVVVLPESPSIRSDLKEAPEGGAIYSEILSCYLNRYMAEIRERFKVEHQPVCHLAPDREALFSVITDKKFSYLSKGRSRSHIPIVNGWLDHHIEHDRPLTFFLLYHGGYRAWPNPSESSLTFQPDQTELMLLWQIALLQERISGIYPPGIEFAIVINNGVALWTNDIPLESTVEYVRRLRMMLDHLGASTRVSVLVQSEMSGFDLVFDDSAVSPVANLSVDQHRIVERFLGRNCDAEEASFRYALYQAAEEKWAQDLAPVVRSRNALVMRQVAHPSTMVFRPFPGGAIRAQNGVLGFRFIGEKPVPILVTSNNFDLGFVKRAACEFPLFSPSSDVLELKVNGVGWVSSEFEAPAMGRIEETLWRSLSRVTHENPDSPAVMTPAFVESYRRLYARVQEIAAEIARRVEPGIPVASIQAPGLDLVASWFGAGLAGSPLLLLDPSLPKLRLAELTEQAGCRVALCDEQTKSKLPIDLVPISATEIKTQGSAPNDFRNALRLDDPSHIFATSGSTGRPKLVTYSNRTMQAKVQASIGLMGVRKEDRVYIAAAHGNFGYMHHALVFLLAGGCLGINEFQSAGLATVARFIREREIKNVRFTPSVFRAFASLPEASETLREMDALRFAGEALLVSDLRLARQMLPKACRIQNIYGNTESGLFFWNADDRMDPAGFSVPFGRAYPLWHYRIEPIDGQRDLNGEGELITRSRYQALGDWTEGGVETERFPVCEEYPSERLFRTGDLVRQEPDGALVLLGRLNEMVKINGQRVYLPEVENHLRHLSGVNEAAVLETAEGGRLIGFVTMASQMKGSADPRKELSKRLPSFMVPGQIHVRESLPTLPSGKIDKEMLRTESRRLSPRTSRAPEDDKLAQIKDIWRSVLKTEDCDLDSDFFISGGDSLSLLNLLAEVERRYCISIEPDDFLRNPTLAGLAEIVGVSTDSKTIPQKELLFRQVRQANGTGTGDVIMMPGWGGKPYLDAILKTDLLASFNIWAAELDIQLGNVTHLDRWWRVARKIARHIREGKAPRPVALVGFSIAGTISWLVAASLAGTRWAPSFVIMIDGPAISSLPVVSKFEFARYLKELRSVNMPPSLHIHRAEPRESGYSINHAYEWSPRDGIRAEILLPTLEHLDLNRPAVLSLAKAGVEQFIRSPEQPMRLEIPLHCIETDGGALFAELVGEGRFTAAEWSALARDLPSTGGQQTLVALLCVLLREGYFNETQILLDRLIGIYPRSSLYWYAKGRTRRMPLQAAIDDRSPVPLQSSLSIELALRKSGARQTSLIRGWILRRLEYFMASLMGASQFFERRIEANEF